MALFKICRGNETNLPAQKTDGWAYFCTDTGNFFIDWADTAGLVSRTQINSDLAHGLHYLKDGEYVELDAATIHNQLSLLSSDKADAITVSTHIADKKNPHGVTKSQVGLGNVDNTSDANKPVSTAQAAAIADAKKAGTDAQSGLSSHIGNTANPHNVTAAQVGADPKGTATSAVNSHNTNTSAHNDIRDLISGLTNRMNALANSDDTTLDQMAEVVAYIKNNKSLIDGITTSKINVSDIVNNLTTNTASKVLSAAQGVAIKALIDALQKEVDTHEANHSAHVSYSTTAPVMDGAASAGSATTVARSDHKHPTDTSRASASDLSTLQGLVGTTKVSTQISDAISSALSDFNPVAIDTTLSVSGKAADAKAVGDAIADAVYSDGDDEYTATTPINADTLGGRPASEFATNEKVEELTAGLATETFVTNKIADAQLGGGDSTIDLSGYATKDELNALTAEDVGAFSTGYATTAINDLSDGVWIVSANAANAPSASACIIYHKTWDTNFKVQEAVDAEGKWYHRCKMSGNWSGWNRADLASLTYSSVGAAPSGYGLGAEPVTKNWSEVDSLFANGWYRFVNINATINGVTVISALVRVDGFNSIYKTQTLYAVNTASGSSEIPVLKRTCGYGNTWQPWECVNPIFVDGVEYRTTERWNGLPVYCKTLGCGALVAAGNQKQVATGIPGSSRIIRHSGFVINSSGYRVSLPILSTDGGYISYHIVNDGYIYFVCRNDGSAYTSSYITLWYTKD